MGEVYGESNAARELGIGIGESEDLTDREYKDQISRNQKGLLPCPSAVRPGPIRS